MRKVGIMGGLGPESTIDYYRRILEAWQGVDPSTAPSILIDSLDVQRALRLVNADLPALIEYLSASVDRLAAAGVDFIAMSANTPHLVFDEVAARAPVPMLSIAHRAHEGRAGHRRSHTRRHRTAASPSRGHDRGIAHVGYDGPARLGHRCAPGREGTVKIEWYRHLSWECAE